MATLSEAELRRLLSPFLSQVNQNALPPAFWARISAYLDLLLRWNARTNLTSVREPQEIVERHFGESLFCGAVLASELGPAKTLLDLGSGAGFPGLPLQFLFPGLQITLAESQGKKAAFLREVVRTCDLPTEVWSARVETMLPSRKFDVVALRAVDRMETITRIATGRVRHGGLLVRLTSTPVAGESITQIPGATRRVVAWRRC